MEVKTIVAGQTININRSDGRVHPAVVVSINQESNFVRVEWFEDGETKGKDLDFRVASMLNPTLKFNNTALPESPKKIVNETNNLPRKNIPVNNRRTNIGRKRITPVHELETPEIIPKLTTSRSQLKDPQYHNSFSQELSKIDKAKTEKRNKKSLAPKDINTGVRRTQNNLNKKLAAMVAEERAKLVFSPLATDDVVEDHLITVCVRKRPLNKFEMNKNEVDIISVPKKNNLIVHEPKTKVDLTRYIDNHNFKFDYAFDENCNNSVVYKYTAQPLVKTIFEGGFATCFAYGQTGSGKTYTMSGDVAGADLGIYALAISDVFKLISSPRYKHLNLIVSCSFFEIYSGKVLDLLNSKSTLKILEDGKQQVQVVGLKEKHVISTNDVMNLISKGDILRTSGQTSANANSSRSHAVFQIYLRKNGSVYGKLSLIDLAGNERGADTFSSDRQTRLEGGEINKSLLALKECIRALGRKGAHLPFRVSKLTQVLRDSFVGNNSRTCMIAMVSPGVGSCENTLNTLRYADRVKELGSGDQSNESTAANSKMDIPTNLPCIADDDEDIELRYTNELQNSEDKLVDNHRNMLVKLTEIEKQGQNLLKMTNGYAFDKTSYVNKFEQLIDDTISQLLVTKDYIDDFKTKLSQC
ncbi:kinesin-like protein KIF2A [Coccinella septempunctata]|uniref:kinesin-like protein KIF2A n=1 Tax=Coccinella septempunctata TaxID=41139 RepID=UPI001D07B6AD|nr:kinesin-like protein KIF2A [Coccinella septempunctata]